MIDDPTNPATSATEPQATAAGESTVAYCQQCGRPLTPSTRQQVGAGTFCPPCASVRRAQAPDWTPVAGKPPYPGSGPGPGPGAPPYSAASVPSYRGAAQPASTKPNPVLAGFLGLIPGVGAMYNGQYAKGAIHLIVFVVLVSLADNLNWVLWWLVWGWIFYQAFEAYHTAQARRDGQTIPDPFGWNDLGERLGFPRSWPAYPPAAAGPRPGPATGQPPMQPAGTQPPPSYVPVAGTSGSSAALDPTEQAPHIPAPGSAWTAPPPFASPVPPPASSAAHASTQIPYGQTFTGPATVPPMVPVPAVLAGPSPRRFPVGALWLIGLGVLFLLGNILPNWHIAGRWLVPILLACVALWTGSTRFADWRDARTQTPLSTSVEALSNTLLFPAILFTLAVLLAFQAADILRLRHSWPALLIVWGALLILGRASDSATSRRKTETTRKNHTSILS